MCECNGVAGKARRGATQREATGDGRLLLFSLSPNSQEGREKDQRGRVSLRNPLPFFSLSDSLEHPHMWRAFGLALPEKQEAERQEVESCLAPSLLWVAETEMVGHAQETVIAQLTLAVVQNGRECNSGCFDGFRGRTLNVICDNALLNQMEMAEMVFTINLDLIPSAI